MHQVKCYGNFSVGFSVMSLNVVVAGLARDFQAWTDKVEVFRINEHLPWCKPYGIYTDKFDEMLQKAQLGKIYLQKSNIQWQYLFQQNEKSMHDQVTTVLIIFEA
jgi:hypothetical protein